MIEAVDWRWHDRFLAACAGLLADDGLAAVQAIVIDDRSFERAKHHRDFVRRHGLPRRLPAQRWARSPPRWPGPPTCACVDLEDIGPHYAETLRRWAANLEANAAAVAELGLPAEFRSLWSLYLAYCEASFTEHHVSDVQLVLAKPGRTARRWAPAA